MSDPKTILEDNMVAANVGGTLPDIFYREGASDQKPTRIENKRRGVELSYVSREDEDLDLQRQHHSQGSADYYLCRIRAETQAQADLDYAEIVRVLRTDLDDDTYLYFDWNPEIKWSGPKHRREAEFLISCVLAGTEI